MNPVCQIRPGHYESQQLQDFQQKTCEWLTNKYGDHIGVGTLQATNNWVFEAINPSVSQLQEWIKQQPHVHVDESPWPVLRTIQRCHRTTNQAERSLRLAVTKRKVSGGSRSMEQFAQTADSQSCGADLSATGAVGHGVF